jgi:hypothetical protein
MVELPVDLIQKYRSTLIAVSYVLYFKTVKGYVQCSQLTVDSFE